MTKEQKNKLETLISERIKIMSDLLIDEENFNVQDIAAEQFNENIEQIDELLNEIAAEMNENK